MLTSFGKNFPRLWVIPAYPFVLYGSSLVRQEILSVQLTVLSVLKNYILLLDRNLNIIYKCDVFV